MRCVSCKDGEMKKDKSAYFADLGTCYVIIENVPCYKCEKCGEVFYPASVAEKIESILERVGTIASKIFIFDYTNAA
mgnify:FL=1